MECGLDRYGSEEYPLFEREESYACYGKSMANLRTFRLKRKEYEFTTRFYP